VRQAIFSDQQPTKEKEGQRLKIFISLQAFDTDDRDVRLIKQTNRVGGIDHHEQVKAFLFPYFTFFVIIWQVDDDEELSTPMTDETNLLDKFVQQNPLASQIYVNASSISASETSEVRVRPPSVNLKVR
jgi:hypothetical protein